MLRKKKNNTFPFTISKIKAGLFWYHTIAAMLFGELIYPKVELVEGHTVAVYKLWNTLYFIPCKVDKFRV